MGDHLLLRIIGIILAFSSLVSSAERFVTPSVEVTASPGLNQEMTTLCERLHIRGISRSRQMYKYAHSLEYGNDKVMLKFYTRWLISFSAFCGHFAIKSQLLLTQNGSIDLSTSLFISWAIRIFAAVLILLSSGDALLAWGALIYVIVMSRMLRTITYLIYAYAT